MKDLDQFLAEQLDEGFKATKEQYELMHAEIDHSIFNADNGVRDGQLVMIQEEEVADNGGDE